MWRTTSKASMHHRRASAVGFALSLSLSLCVCVCGKVSQPILKKVAATASLRQRSGRGKSGGTSPPPPSRSRSVARYWLMSRWARLWSASPPPSGKTVPAKSIRPRWWCSQVHCSICNNVNNILLVGAGPRMLRSPYRFTVLRCRDLDIIWNSDDRLWNARALAGGKRLPARVNQRRKTVRHNWRVSGVRVVREWTA